jgi:hypothetical protein
LLPGPNPSSIPRGGKDFEKPFLPDIHKTNSTTNKSDSNGDERTRSTVLARKNISLGGKKSNYDFQKQVNST